MSDAYALAAEIRAALTDIADHYDAALIPPRRTTIRPMPKDDRDHPKMRPAHKVWEHSPAPANVDVLEVRRKTHIRLADCARIVLMECRTIDDGAIHRDLNEAPIRGLCAFVSTWAGIVAEQNPVEAAGWARDLSDYGRRLRQYAYPDRPNLVIGACPLRPDLDADPCGGTVRLRDDEDDAKCGRCGEVAVVRWWEARMLPADDGAPLVTATELIRLCALEGHIVSHDLIRLWAHRGKLPRAGRDGNGRVLYERQLGLNLVRQGKVA